jgi:Ca2+-binding RTX toxin-like protein
MAILTLTDSNPNANNVTEGLNTAVAIDINASGGTGIYFFSIGYDPTGGAFAIDASGIVTIVDASKIDYEALVDGKLTLSIHVQDTGNNYGDAQFTINVGDVNGVEVNGADGVDDDIDAVDGVAGEEDELNGLSGKDTIVGLGGDDTITGGDDDDDIDGGAGNDALYGNDGDDIIVGGAGDDYIEGGDKGAAGDDLDGGLGFDTVSYFASSAAVTIDLNDQNGVLTQSGGDAEDDILQGFEGVVGSKQADTITGSNTAADVIEGGEDADILDGQDSDPLFASGVYEFDTVSYEGSSKAVTVSLGKQGVTTTGKGGDAEGDQIKNFENIIGSAQADTLSIVENGMIEGGAGADIMSTTSDGGTLSYVSSNAAVTVALAAAGKQGTGTGGHAQGDKYTNFDSVLGSNYNDKLTGNELGNALLGGTGDDVLSGGAGKDTLVGDNVLSLSFAGATIVYPFGQSHLGGNDTLTGGDGDDYLIGGIGSDIIDGGAGFDTVGYQSSNAPVTITLGTKGAAAVQTGGDAGGDKLTAVEGVIGSAFDDIITGNDLDNIIEGGAGKDKLFGGTGNDTVSYLGAPDTGNDDTGVTVDLTKQDAILAQAGDSDENGDVLHGFENIIGSFYDDELTGDTFNNIIEGGGGKDKMAGGLGHDIVSYRNYDNFLAGGGTTGVTISLTNVGAITVGDAFGDAVGDTGSEFEGIHGSAYYDILTGNTEINTILGLDGNDLIDGGDEADFLDGGNGTDTVDYSKAAVGVTVTLGAANVKTTVTGGDKDTILNFENVLGSAFDDKLTGNAGNNYFLGGDGKDIINGGAGLDTVDYTGTAAAVTVVLGTGVTKVGGGDGDTDELSLIENITGTAHNDTLTGNSLANVLDGGDGDDLITGGAGADTLIGGKGKDTFFFSGTEGLGDIIQGGDDDDTVQIKDPGTSSLVATLENFSSSTGSIEIFIGNGKGIVGTAKNNILDFSDLKSFTGVNGTIDGLGGDDVIKAFATEAASLVGGLGNDTLIGGDKNDTLNGGDGEDTILGGDGADGILGGAGDDHIEGGLGADSLRGNAGADFIDGGAGDDVIYVTGAEAAFDLMKGGADADTVQIEGTAVVTFALFDATTNGIEALKGATNSNIVGTADDNLLDFSLMTITDVLSIDGAAGNDKMVGSNSNDTLRGGLGDDVLSGGAGNDTLNGGAGIDTIDGGANDDTIIVVGTEAQYDSIDGGAGSNTLRIDGTAALLLSGFNATASNIQTLQGNKAGILGDADNNTLNFFGLTKVENMPFVDGGAGNDTITAWAAGADLRGGAGDDTLNGSDNADILNGGAGIDTLNGGDGNDTFNITGIEAQFDTMNGGAGATDTIVVLGSVAVTLNAFAANGIEFWTGNGRGVLGNQFANTLDFTGITANAVGTIDGAGGNDTITGSSGADVILGGVGDDTLNGGDGNDTLTGGTGVDTVNGGAGSDTIVIAGTDGMFDTIDGGADTDTLSLTTATVTLNGLNAATSFLETLVGKTTTILGNAGDNTFDLSGFTTVTGLKSVDGGAGNDTIIGVNLASFADDLKGNAGDDTLTGGRGNDKLTGGSGSDTFIFDAADFGKDTITDFGVGFDEIHFDMALFANFGEVQDAMTQVGANTVITLDGDNTITLTNVTASLLTASQFDFIP